MLLELADLIANTPADHPLRVGIDGPDAAGKTTIADELADLLGPRWSVVRLSVDGFHRPRAERQRRGPLSPEGYYFDSFDNDAIVQSVLKPLRDGSYVGATFDHRTDRAVDPGIHTAASDAIVLFDGVFLLRPELREYWDLAIYLHIEPAETIRRAHVRDLELFGSTDIIDQRYHERYLPGQALYRSVAAPMDRADIVLDMTDAANPIPLKWPG